MWVTLIRARDKRPVCQASATTLTRCAETRRESQVIIFYFSHILCLIRSGKDSLLKVKHEISTSIDCYHFSFQFWYLKCHLFQTKTKKCDHDQKVLKSRSSSIRISRLELNQCHEEIFRYDVGSLFILRTLEHGLDLQVLKTSFDHHFYHFILLYFQWNRNRQSIVGYLQ